MKGELIKVDNGWLLTVDQVIYATDNDKLSLKNCQAIENGYDLDELYDELDDSDFLDKYEDSLHYYSFIEGFQKAIEILGDKKFSEGDMKKACSVGIDIVNQEGENDFRLFEDLLETLQPTEWDVTFNPDEKDSDGCLILKRI